MTDVYSPKTVFTVLNFCYFLLIIAFVVVVCCYCSYLFIIYYLRKLCWCVVNKFIIFVTNYLYKFFIQPIYVFFTHLQMHTHIHFQFPIAITFAEGLFSKFRGPYFEKIPQLPSDQHLFFSNFVSYSPTLACF